MEIKKRLRVESSIPTCSMADIAFLLIIFFLVSTTMYMDQGLGLTLPAFGQGVKVRKENICNVWINAQGRIAIDGEEVQLDRVRRIIEDKLATNENLIVSLKTDREAEYDVMVNVLDELKLAEAKKISLALPD